MSLTAEQITAVKAEIDAKYPNLGADNVAGYLNEEVGPDLVQVSRDEQKIDIHKADLLAAMTQEENAALILFRESGTIEAKVFDEFYKAADYFTVNHPRFIATMQGLNTAGILSADTLNAVLILGKRKASKADALIGRKITVDEVREVIG